MADRSAAVGVGRQPFASPEQRLRVEVADHIRSEIFAGRMKRGSRVDQDGVASSLGLSRLPVREALILLEREGLIVFRPRRGAFVADLTEDDLVDHFELLALIRGYATMRYAPVSAEETAVRMDLWERLMEGRGDERAIDDQLVAMAERGMTQRLKLEIDRLAPMMLAAWRVVSSDGVAHAELQLMRDQLTALQAGDRVRAGEITAEAIRRYGRHVIERLRSQGFFAG